MGAWGVGLYSGDFAADLKQAVAAVARLPLDAAAIVAALCEIEPGAAEDPRDADHTVFWLVLADQFEKRGIASSRVREMAATIIDRGSDAAMMTRLGMKPADLRKRAAVLADLRVRLDAQPSTSKPRATLTQPEPYVMDVGSLYSYPTLNGEGINPYMTAKYFDRAAWRPDGFGLMLIVNRGRAFDYLAWYQPLVAEDAVAAPPELPLPLQGRTWRLQRPGTCKASHFKKMELAVIGSFATSLSKLAVAFPGQVKDGRSAAISNISIANAMFLRRGIYPRGHPPPINDLAAIAADASAAG